MKSEKIRAGEYDITLHDQIYKAWKNPYNRNRWQVQDPDRPMHVIFVTRTKKEALQYLRKLEY